MPKKTKITLSDVAKMAGVSTSTASRALNNNPLIKEATRKRIQHLARQHNFQPNAAASHLRTQQSKVVAVILNLTSHTEQSVNDPFLLKVVANVNKALNAVGYELLLSNSSMAPDDWAQYYITSCRADGLIIIGQGKDDSQIIKAASQGVPLVTWGDTQISTNYPVVGSDNRLGGFIATRHLLTSGRKRIIFLGDPEHLEMQQRYLGYLDALRESGTASLKERVIDIDITNDAAFAAITQDILRNGLTFDGIVACSDMVALGATRALKMRYINIPGDVAIVGFDDIPLAEMFYPSLTTIRQHTDIAAGFMVEMLLAQIRGDTVDSKTVDIDLIQRDSA